MRPFKESLSLVDLAYLEKSFAISMGLACVGEEVL